MRRWLRFIVSILAVPIVGLTTLASSSAQVVPPVATPTDGVGSDREAPNPGGSELLPGPEQLTQRPLDTVLPTPLGPGPGTVQDTPTPTGAPGIARTPEPLTPGRTFTPGVLTTPTPALAARETPDLVILTATLTGRAESPGPGDEDGLGSAAIVVDATRQMVCFALHATNVEQPTAAHIHEGAVGVAGPIVVPLAAPVDGNVSGCTQDVDREVLSRLIQTPAGFYVNVHNAEFPAGAVRGQLGR